MSQTTRPTWLLPLALLSLTCLIGVTLTALWHTDRAQRDVGRLRASARLRLGLEDSVSTLRKRLAACIETWTDEEHDEYDEDEASRRRWTRIQAAALVGPASIGAEVAIYEGTWEDESQRHPPELALLGHATEVRFWLATEEQALTPALPTALLSTEILAGNGEQAEPALIWFASTAGEVTIHTIGWVAAEEEEEEGESEEEEEVEELPLQHLYVFHLQAAFPVPANTRAIVRCDIENGRFAPRLPPFVVAGSLGESQVDSIPLPAETYAVLAGRHPIPNETARLALYVPPADGAPLALVFLAIASALGLLVTGFLYLRRAGGDSAAAPTLTGEAAHEMRTPLTVMRGTLEVALRREREPEQYRQTLRDCLDEVEDLQALQEAVLLLSRTPQRPATQEDVDVNALIAGEVERVQTGAPDREVSVEAPKQPLFVKGDPALLARAVANLLDNAALHSVAGGFIHTTVQRSGRQVEIVVEDEGPGIPEERRDAVFERFYRGPDVGRRGIPGSGLGLPIVRWIAQQHGGDVRLDPRATRRGRFLLRFPLASAAD